MRSLVHSHTHSSHPSYQGKKLWNSFQEATPVGDRSPANICVLEIICSCLWVPLRKLDFHLHRVCSMDLHSTVNRHSNTQQPLCVRNSRDRHITKGSERDWLNRALSKLSSVPAGWQDGELSVWILTVLYPVLPTLGIYSTYTQPPALLQACQVSRRCSSVDSPDAFGRSCCRTSVTMEVLVCLHDHPGLLWIYDTGQACLLRKVAVTFTGY